MQKQITEKTASMSDKYGGKGRTIKKKQSGGEGLPKTILKGTADKIQEAIKKYTFGV